MSEVDVDLGHGEGSAEAGSGAAQEADADPVEQPLTGEARAQKLRELIARRQPRVLERLAARGVTVPSEERRRQIAAGGWTPQRRPRVVKPVTASADEDAGARGDAAGEGASAAEAKVGQEDRGDARPIVVAQRTIRRSALRRPKKKPAKRVKRKVRRVVASRRKVRAVQRKRKPAARVVKRLPRKLPPKRPVSHKEPVRRVPFAGLEQRFFVAAEQVLAEAKSWPLAGASGRKADRKLAAFSRIVRRFAELTR